MGTTDLIARITASFFVLEFPGDGAHDTGSFPTMPQNRESGAAANARGRVMAVKVARAIGATMTRKGSNEAKLDGKTVVVKYAAPRTTSIGVSKKMLPHIDFVLGALHRKDGLLDVVSLPAGQFRREMTETRSKGSSARRVGMVPKRLFMEAGVKIATVSV